MTRERNRMSPTRRQFFGTVAASSGALALGSIASPRLGRARTVSAAPQPLRVLILGGTGFIGPHMVRYALERGHSVTIFNRGRTNPHLFPEVEKLVGDRDGQLGALEGKSWDVVLDNSGYVPRHVRDSAQLLKDVTDHYLF
ncbi:MAG: NAD-dependent epimerase/dehydratase family protein, partial [Gemmatimonadetes bacterium]|nr:NAD-dependent epimerase/dehydratase family protein [Gemmatimonadota bacterium]